MQEGKDAGKALQIGTPTVSPTGRLVVLVMDLDKRCHVYVDGVDAEVRPPLADVSLPREEELAYGLHDRLFFDTSTSFHAVAYVMTRRGKSELVRLDFQFVDK